MDTRLVISLVVTGSMFILLIIVSSILLRGKGANMLTVYNSLSLEEQKDFDAEKMCKFMGKIILTLAFAVLLLFISFIIKSNGLHALFIAITMSLIFFSIGVTSSSRFRKA